jgi:hypothetical protein
MQWMRGQMVCYSYGVDMGDKVTQYESKWTFTPSKFTNCSFGLNNVGNDVVFSMGIGPKNAGLGTLSRTLINQGCSSGNVSISATAKNAQ